MRKDLPIKDEQDFSDVKMAAERFNPMDFLPDRIDRNFEKPQELSQDKED